MKTPESDRIRLDFLRSQDYPVLNRLGMTSAPGKRFRGSITGDQARLALTDDIRHLRDHYEVDALVSLVENEELRQLGIEAIEQTCRDQGLELLQFPIKDRSTPDSLDKFTELIISIRANLSSGHLFAIHCHAGLGRTGMTAACAAIAISNGDIDGVRAIDMVRIARPGTVETEGQEKFVVEFARHWRSVEQ